MRMAQLQSQTVTPAVLGCGFEADVECDGLSMEVTIKIRRRNQYRIVTQENVRIQIH